MTKKPKEKQSTQENSYQSLLYLEIHASNLFFFNHFFSFTIYSGEERGAS